MILSCYVRNPLNFEKKLHNKFKHKRLAGEWFDLNKQDIKMIFAEFVREELDSFKINYSLFEEEQIDKDDYIEYLESLIAMHGIKVEYGKKKSQLG